MEWFKKKRVLPRWRLMGILFFAIVFGFTLALALMKGTGWYETDFKTGKKKNLAKSDNEKKTSSQKTDSKKDKKDKGSKTKKESKKVS